MSKISYIWKNIFKRLTVKSFWEFINKFIEIFRWIMVNLIPFFVDLQWIVSYWSGKWINKYNEYNYNPATIKFRCIPYMVTFWMHVTNWIEFEIWEKINYINTFIYVQYLRWCICGCYRNYFNGEWIFANLVLTRQYAGLRA